MPTVRESLDFSTFIVEWWRSSGNGHTGASYEENGTRDSELVTNLARDGQLHPAKRHGMAVKGRIVAQSGQSQHSGVSHGCHLLSRDLGVLLARHLAW